MPPDLFARDAVLADLDGDGDLDLIEDRSVDGPTAFTYANDGSGRFELDARYPFARVLRLGAIAVGDIDGDGDLDVVRPYYAWLNEGAGRARVVAHGFTGLPMHCVDLSGDGRADVIDELGRVWLAGPGPTFVQSPIGSPLLLVGVTDVAIVDLDRDGRLDLVYGRSVAPELVLRNIGNGVFQDLTAQWFPNAASDETTQVLAADFDGDGDIDCACVSQSGWSWRRNDGTGRLVPYAGPTPPLAPPAYDDRFLSVDLDGDGAVDLLHRGTWLQNDGLGNFTPHAIAAPDVLFAAAGDVDGDGDVDLVSRPPWRRLWLQQPNQVFLDAGARTDPGGQAPVVADFDGDGAPDLLGIGGPLQRNDGAGHFASVPFPWVTGKQIAMPLAVDVDDDSDLDVVYFSYPPAEVRICRNNGQGGFTDIAPGIAPTPVLGLPRTVVPLFANADRWPDLVVSYANGSALQLLRGNAGLRYRVVPGALQGVSRVDAVAAGDFDGDGDQDVVAVDQYPTRLVWFENDANGWFTPRSDRMPSTLPFGALWSQLLPFDADGDGDLDLMIGNGLSGGTLRSQLLRNDGTGTLVLDASALPDVVVAGGTALGDIDGDGDLDAVVRADVDGVWRNDGAGNFAVVGSWPGLTPRGAPLVDIDGDGDADLVLPDHVELSRNWHAEAPFLARLGRDYVLRFESLDMPGALVLPMLADTPARVPFAIGALGLDPARVVPLPLIQLNGGSAELVLPVANAATLVGTEFWAQAVLLDGVRVHLTPVVRDVVHSR